MRNKDYLCRNSFGDLLKDADLILEKIRILGKTFEFSISMLKGNIDRMIASTPEYGTNVSLYTVEYEKDEHFMFLTFGRK